MKNKQKKIAVIGITYPFRGGISHYTTILARSLRKLYDVTFISFKRQYPKILFPGVTQYDYSANTIKEENSAIIDSVNPLTWLKAARKARDFGAEVAIFQWYNPFFAFVVYVVTRQLKKYGVKPVIICHNVIPHEASIFNRILTKIAFLHCDDFLVHSKADMDNLRAIKSDAKILKGYHPTYDVFDYESSSEGEARAKLGITEGKVILFFGYIRKYKGLDVLIEAFAKVRGKLKARLLIVGEFYDDKKKYTELIEKLGLTDSVTIVDEYVPNEAVSQYYHASDVVILPYTSASQSGIVQIAYALGKPIIATDAGGLPDVVIDGVTGYVVKKRDVANLADGIMRFYGDSDLKRFNQNITKELEKYSWDSLVETLSNLFGYQERP